METTLFSSLGNLNWLLQLAGDAAGVIVDVISITDAMSVGVETDFHEQSSFVSCCNCAY